MVGEEQKLGPSFAGSWNLLVAIANAKQFIGGMPDASCPAPIAGKASTRDIRNGHFSRAGRNKGDGKGRLLT